MEITQTLLALKQFDKAREANSREAERKGKASEDSVSRGDSVKISDQAKLYGRALRIANESPDVRALKVQELKQLVENGQYRPDSRRIAEKLVQHDLKMII
jgi:negative regulator of flagellin synthesis FlgM